MCYRFYRIILPLAASAICLTAGAGDRKMNFNSGWRFSQTDTVGVLADNFNDKGWRRLTLPHDWSVEGRFDKNAPMGNDGGYLPDGVGWYRKSFNVPADRLHRKIQLYFEGAYMKSDVYINGHRAGGHPYGYSSFWVDATPYLKPGENTVAVRVDNSMQKNCRWYSGSGIYRNVWLTETDKTHIANWGVRISTPDLDRALVRTFVVNEDSTEKKLELATEIDNISDSYSFSIAPGDTAVIEQWIKVPGAKPWSPDSPQLYTANVTLKDGTKVIDNIDQRFGFRTLEWSADGFKLNGETIRLNGGCAHHDNGILGAAAFDRAERKRVEQLKEAGFNAVRTSHNIPSETFLDACDEAGILVIDEPFDGWRDKKNEYDYSSQWDRNWKTDLDIMLMRDFNHPSIFCWSVGNEVIERDKIEIVARACDLVARCHEIDPYRPVTSALANWGKEWRTYDPLAEAFDIVGYNYTIHESESDHARDPQRVMMQTESYPNDTWKNYRKVQDFPYIIGDFVWTAMDYIGESGIGRYYYDGDVPGEHYHRPLFPWHAAYCGDIDLTGLRKPVSHYRSMLWNRGAGDEHLFIAVREPDGYNGRVKTTQWGTWPTFESWNWPRHEGKDIEVVVYSHYPSVRLYLDDNLIGEKVTEEMKAVFTLPYKAGTLRAEGVEDGRVAESRTLPTAGEVAEIRLTPDSRVLAADEGDLSYVVIEFIDKDGNVVPLAANDLTVDVSGAGILQALGNADIKECDPYFDNTHKAWMGRALAVVRPSGKKGKAIIKVSSPGLASKSVTLTMK